MREKTQPIVIVPSRNDSERSYINKLLSDKATLGEFLKANGIKGWPTTNRDNPQNNHGNTLKFWDGYFIG